MLYATRKSFLRDGTIFQKNLKSRLLILLTTRPHNTCYLKRFYVLKLSSFYFIFVGTKNDIQAREWDIEHMVHY
jgi:hypothetical protein